MPISHMGCVLSLLMVPVKIIMNKLTGLLEECGFVEFIFHAAAERALQAYNGTQMPGGWSRSNIQVKLGFIWCW